MNGRKTVLYIGMSLDGYIADKNGGVGWMGDHGASTEDPGSYPAFIQTIDTVIMGWTTYHQVTTELSPDEWVYPGLDTWVITHRKLPADDHDQIRFTDQDPCGLVKDLLSQDGKDIWICGGASIVQQLLREDLIDTFYISVIPTLLGEGIRLFQGPGREKKLRLVKNQSYNGVTDLVYERRSR